MNMQLLLQLTLTNLFYQLKKNNKENYIINSYNLKFSMSYKKIKGF
jgi:hypothetical protein